MSPTLSDADVVLVRQTAVIQPGQVVLVRWAGRPGQLSIKRATRSMGKYWFVAGDNQLASTDSRELGPAEVLAVVSWRLWPRLTRIRRLLKE